MGTGGNAPGTPWNPTVSAQPACSYYFYSPYLPRGRTPFAGTFYACALARGAGICYNV